MWKHMLSASLILLTGIALIPTVCSAQGHIPVPPLVGSDSADEATESREAAELTRQLRSALANRTGGHDDANINYCLGRLSLLGERGIEPLCNTIRDPQWGATAIYDLAAMLDRHRVWNVPVGGKRWPISVASIQRQTLGELSQIVPQVRTLALRQGANDGDRGACLALLAAMAPSVQAALSALVDVAVADAIPPEYRAQVAGLLVTADAQTRRRIEMAVARGGDCAKEIAELVRLWALPPAETATRIMAMNEQQKLSVLSWLPADEKRTTPVLIELLADPRFPEGLLRNLGPSALPAIRAALRHPNAVVRVRAAAMLPDDELRAAVEELAGVLGTSANGVPETAQQIQNALCRAGDFAIPAVIARTRDPNPAARAAAATALGWFGPDQPENAKITEAARARAADALVAMLVDSDAPTRVAAAAALGRLGAAAGPRLAAALKTLSSDERSRLAGALAGLPGGNGHSADAVGLGATAAAIEALQKNADPAVREAADDILFQRGMLLEDRAWALAPTKPLDAGQQAALATLKSPTSADQRIASLHLLYNATDPSVVAVLLPLLTDPAPEVRIETARCLLGQRTFISSAPAFVGVINLWVNDPQLMVREALNFHLGQWLRPGAESSALQLRLRVMARRTTEDQRWAVASLLGVMENRAPVMSADLQRQYMPELSRLASDQSPKVRVAATHTAASWLTFNDGPGSQTAELATKLLRSSDAEVRAAALDALWLLPPQIAQGFTSSTDPQLRAAALLALEQPPNTPAPIPSKRVAVETATTALTGTSHRFRELAARTLMYDDPADPQRSDRGLQALLNAANSPRNEVAADALRALVPVYCGPLVPDPATHRFTYISRGAMPNPLPVPWPVWITRMVSAALNGPVENRVKVIRQIGDSEAKFLAGRWDLFQRLFLDADPTIRAEAFAAARKATFKAIAARPKLKPQTTSPSQTSVPTQTSK